ncbi:MAG TPA: hypothetical protein VED40_19500 [Azospirillaceae bacterium]|nr:hypothetical protein [Azospirillaceae bacterium]
MPMRRESVAAEEFGAGVLRSRFPAEALPRDGHDPDHSATDTGPLPVIRDRPLEKFMALWCGLSWTEGAANFPSAPVGTPMILTYSFMESLPAYFSEEFYAQNPGAYRTGAFSALTEAQRANARLAFDMITQATGIRFVEVPDAVGGEIRMGMGAMQADLGGFAYLPSVDQGHIEDLPNGGGRERTDFQGVAGDIFVSSLYYASSTLAPGTEGFAVVMHEIGHALGLVHPKVGFAGLTEAESGIDSSVMALGTGGAAAQNGVPAAFRPLDLQVLRYIYGTPEDEARLDGQVTRTLDRTSWTYTMTGAAADDVILGTNLRDTVRGGAGRDLLNGLGADDLLDGGDEADRLDGGIGNDTLLGGAGDDYMLGNFGDDVFEGGAGQDLMEGSYGNDSFTARGEGDIIIGEYFAPTIFTDTVDYSRAGGAVTVDLGADYQSMDTRQENAIRALNHDGTVARYYNIGYGIVAGGAQADQLINVNRIIGTPLNDSLRGRNGAAPSDETLSGGAGNDTIEGFGAGNFRGSRGDLLLGSTGDDLYIVREAAGERVQELAGEGTDTVRFIGSGAYTLPDHVEDGTILAFGAESVLTGTAAANRLSVDAAGLPQGAVLRGLGGADTLTGGGGAETLEGGAGDDLLTGGISADLFLFGADSAGGRDTIADFQLKVTVTGGTDLIRLTGGLSYTTGTGAEGWLRLILSNGAIVDLTGIAPAAFDPAWVASG